MKRKIVLLVAICIGVAGALGLLGGFALARSGGGGARGHRTDGGLLPGGSDGRR